MGEQNNEKKPTRAEFMNAAAEKLAEATKKKPFAEAVRKAPDNDGIFPEPDTEAELEDDFLPGDDIPQQKPEEEPEKPAGPPRKQIKRSPKRRVRFRLNKRILKPLSRIGAVVCGMFLMIYIYGCLTVPKDRMGRNIYIENINVSNMTFEEALAAVRSSGLLEDQNIVLSCKGQKYEINGADIGLTPRLEDTVEKAMLFGKTDNIFIDGFANTLQLFAPHRVVPSANADEPTLRAKLREFGAQLYGELQYHSLSVGDGVITATPGHSGFDMSDNPEPTDKALSQIRETLGTKGKFHNIPVTLEISSPPNLTADEISAFAYLDPVDASYALENNKISVVAETKGRSLDPSLAAELASKIREGGEPMSVPYTESAAAITSETLSLKLFNATIGSYTTSYGTSNANRCSNISNAAGKINGKILLPGDVFSFNATVGPRSAANGFRMAKEYVNGETVDGIGGGTCQVSSTLYNACIYSDLSIISRTNHMFPVGYCPLGQDATVADTGVDFKFVNSMDYPIKISTSASGYRLTVSIIGTQRDDPRTVKVVNSVTRIGEDTRVTSTRQVYNSSGELIDTDQLPASHYKPHN